MKSFFLASALLGLTANAIPIDDVKPRGFEEMAAASNSELVERISFSTTRNELGQCAPITVIFARGTVEPGNVGDLAGPQFFNALDILYGDSNVAVQGVNYPATIGGYLRGGDVGGAATLAALTNQAASECPHSQIILSGYSQGAQLVHLGVKQISAQVASRVKAVVGTLTQFSSAKANIARRLSLVTQTKVKRFRTSLRALLTHFALRMTLFATACLLLILSTCHMRWTQRPVLCS